MPNEKNENPIQSEHLLQEASDNFDKICAVLSELPTDRAMKELSETKVGIPNVRRTIEAMAFSKHELVKAMRLMFIREKALIFENQMLMKRTPIADQIIGDYFRNNPDSKIQFEDFIK